MHDGQSINSGGNMTNSRAGRMLTNCTNTINQLSPGEKKDLLEELRRQVEELIRHLVEDKADEAPRVATRFQALLDQATSAKPDREWYLMSATGVVDASKWTKDFAGNIRGTVSQLGKLFWPDFEVPGAD